MVKTIPTFMMARILARIVFMGLLRSIPRLTDCLKHYQLAGKEILFSECFDVDEARSADVGRDYMDVVECYLHGSGAAKRRAPCRRSSLTYSRAE